MQNFDGQIDCEIVEDYEFDMMDMSPQISPEHHSFDPEIDDLWNK
jgi:hypothetical protein